VIIAGINWQMFYSWKNLKKKKRAGQKQILRKYFIIVYLSLFAT